MHDWTACKALQAVAVLGDAQVVQASVERTERHRERPAAQRGKGLVLAWLPRLQVRRIDDPLKQLLEPPQRAVFSVKLVSKPFVFALGQ